MESYTELGVQRAQRERLPVSLLQMVLIIDSVQISSTLFF